MMKLADVMQRNVEVIPSNATVRDAAQRMSKRDIGALPVSIDERIAGMVTDRDLVVRSLARGDDPDKTRVSEIMTREVEWCFEEDSVDEASRKMSARQIQRLLVFDSANRLVGIVSLSDLVRTRGTSPAVTHVIEEIKSPTRSSAVGVDARHVGH
jgi:CBS domain-containing protein